VTDSDDITPVPYHVCANLLLAAAQLFREHHDALGVELLVRAEALIPRVSDPQGFVSLMNQADRLWKSKHVKSGLRPKGMKSGKWEQIDLPFAFAKPGEEN
jgi:hypothetical protein